MAETPVEVFLGTSGLTGVTLLLFPIGVDTQANTEDLMAEQVNRKGLYRATVGEALVGLYEVYVEDGSHDVIYAGFVRLRDDTTVYRAGQLTMSADVPAGAYGEVTVSAPATPDCTTGYVLCLGADGLPEAGVKIYAQMTSGPGTDGYALDNALITMVSDASGLAQHEGFIRGATYKFRRGTTTWWGTSHVAPDTDSWALEEILGSP